MIYKSILIFLFSWSIQACQKPIEACMQPYAQNFNPEADKDCCCQYFQLQLDLEHNSFSDAFPLELGSFYADNSGNSYIPINFQIAISNPRLLDAQGQEYRIQDSVIYTLWDNSRTALWNGVAVVSPNTRLAELGRFDRAGHYQRLRFDVGIPQVWETVNHDLLPTNHPLRNTNLYNDSLRIYNSHQLDLLLPHNNDSLRLSLKETIPIELNINLEIEEGRNNNILLKIAYLKLFDGVNFLQDNQETILEKIKNNTSNIFSIN